MKKYTLFFIAIIIIVAGVLFWEKEAKTPSSEQAISTSTADYKNLTYKVGGKEIKLVNGYAENEIAPGSASKLITKYFGNEAMGDLTGAGNKDLAFLITQSGGGSGIFYYVTTAIKISSGYTGTNAILLGDRIAPQTTEIKDGKIIVNYADRKPGEPMTALPSVGVSKYFKIKNGLLVEIVGSATYTCKNGKTIKADFYKGEQIPVKPGEMPIPTGSVDLKLSDGRTLTLPQTISASGIRYANKDESFVFWSKGNTAFITENNTETYSNCVTPGN